MKRVRLDQRVVELGLAESREKAQRLIRAGVVRVGGHPVSKPGHEIRETDPITLTEKERFVSRGGGKLEAAFQHFNLKVDGLICLDVGASTGGFTDCLLQHGASRVYAVDVGRGQLHWKLQQDERVVVMDEINARHLKPNAFPDRPAFAVMDVSFISLTKVLPAVTQVLADGGGIVTLIKPQFEAGREQVGRGGVVRDPAVRAGVIERVRLFGERELALKWVGVCESPLTGPAGNVEFLAYWRKSGS
jgi:23S rRNA (cytidine1920-2'-O)/16S rRNA (cytidine1409-2'-O)-methyltransferase